MMTSPLITQQITRGQSICPYCGVGCRLWIESAHGELIRVQGVADAPANRGEPDKGAGVVIVPGERLPSP